jgi:hypothetical protein
MNLNRVEPIANSHALAERIPRTQLKLYPDAGHAFLFQSNARTRVRTGAHAGRVREGHGRCRDRHRRVARRRGPRPRHALRARPDWRRPDQDVARKSGPEHGALLSVLQSDSIGELFGQDLRHFDARGLRQQLGRLFH